MYFIKLYRELKEWYIIRRIAISNKEILKEHKLRVDYIGRIYTVINVPEELIEKDYSRQGYVYSKLREYDDVLIKLNINELIYPTIKPIEDTTSYLLILQGNLEYIRFWKIIGHSLLYLFYGFMIKIIINYLIENNVFSNIINFIKDYI